MYIELNILKKMAKKTWTFIPNKKKTHNRHAKSKTTFTKGAKNYIKQYRGQGR